MGFWRGWGCEKKVLGNGKVTGNREPGGRWRMWQLAFAVMISVVMAGCSGRQVRPPVAELDRTLLEELRGERRAVAGSLSTLKAGEGQYLQRDEDSLRVVDVVTVSLDSARVVSRDELGEKVLMPVEARIFRGAWRMRYDLRGFTRVLVIAGDEPASMRAYDVGGSGSSGPLVEAEAHRLRARDEAALFVVEQQVQRGDVQAPVVRAKRWEELDRATRHALNVLVEQTRDGFQLVAPDESHSYRVLGRVGEKPIDIVIGAGWMDGLTSRHNASLEATREALKEVGMQVGER